jgi:hypothetical protein
MKNSTYSPSRTDSNDFRQRAFDAYIQRMSFEIVIAFSGKVSRKREYLCLRAEKALNHHPKQIITQNPTSHTIKKAVAKGNSLFILKFNLLEEPQVQVREFVVRVWFCFC